MTDRYQEIREAFINQWGVLGSQWGVSKTMAQIQALLMTSEDPLTTDDVMAALSISRGNAHGGIKDLQSWGLARKVIVKGERKDYFEAEKDPWKIFFIVASERRRREIEPLVALLSEIEGDSRRLRDDKGKRLHKQMNDWLEFVGLGNSALKAIAGAGKSRLTRWFLRLIKSNKS
jgi:DNA-binding transcriptional regulator GbsR (MarR family)